MHDAQGGVFVMQPIFGEDEKAHLHWASLLQFDGAVSGSEAMDRIWRAGPRVLSKPFPFIEAEREQDGAVAVTVSGKGHSGPSREWVIATYRPHGGRTEAEARGAFAQWLKAAAQGYGPMPGDVVLRPARLCGGGKE